MFFWDPTMIIVIPGIILTLWAQSKVKSTFKKYSRERARSGITGAGVAREILNSNGLGKVGIEPVRGHLTDHYDPRSGVLRLSDGVYDSQSIAALGIAAHEPVTLSSTVLSIRRWRSEQQSLPLRQPVHSLVYGSFL